MLDDQEQHTLAGMEHDLAAGDPGLDRRLRAHRVPIGGRYGWAVAVAGFGMLAAVALFGLGLVSHGLLLGVMGGLPLGLRAWRSGWFPPRRGRGRSDADPSGRDGPGPDGPPVGSP